MYFSGFHLFAYFKKINTLFVGPAGLAALNLKEGRCSRQSDTGYRLSIFFFRFKCRWHYTFKNKKSDHFRNRIFLVGVAGFEPATSCSQSRRDNRATLHPDNSVIYYYKENCGENGTRTHATLTRRQISNLLRYHSGTSPNNFFKELILARLHD